MEVTKKRKFNDSDDRENDDKFHTKKSTSTRVDSSQQAIIGPALPPTKQTLLDIHDELTAGNNSNDLDSDGESDDDDVGPTLPPLTEQVQSGKVTDCPSHRPSVTPPEEQIHTNKKQRDEWMLQPPEKSDWTSNVDPTKLRHRKFQSGKSAGFSSTSRMDTSWLESPEQKMERIKDEVMGVKTSTPAENGGNSFEAPKITEAIQERIQKYNDATRESVARESSNRLGDSSDDPSLRPFDRERDMATSSNISNSQRREMLDRAADFGSRFTGGKLL